MYATIGHKIVNKFNKSEYFIPTLSFGQASNSRWDSISK